MSLTLGLFCAPCARAQNNTGGIWSVTDQQGNSISPHQDGSSFPLKGPMTGSATLSPVYQDVFSVAGQPNSSIGYAFTPNPNDYQGWLFNGGSTPPGGGYDPYHVWTSASADNYASTNSGTMGYLGPPKNECINGSVTADTGGTLWAIFQWPDPYPLSYYASTHQTPPTPPTYVDLLLQTAVRAYADAPANGLSSSATATDSTFNETASAPSGVPLVQGRHLLRVPVDPSTHQAQVSLGGTATATATNSLPYGVLGYYPGTTSGSYFQTTNGPAETRAGSSIGADASLDSRELYITCPAIEASTYKGTPEPENSSGAYTHARASDLSLQTDSVAVWESTEKWCIQDDFDADATNFASPSYSWTVTGLGHSLDDGTGSSTRVQALAQDGSTFPTSTSLTVTVTDSDSATASNTYGVRWHLPYESIGFLGSVRKKTQMKQLYGPVHQGNFADVKTSEAGDIDIDKGFDAAGAVAAASGQEEIGGLLDIIGKLAAITDFKYHYGGEEIHTGTYNNQGKWQPTLNNPDWAANVDTPWLLNYQDPRDHSYDGWVFCDLSIWEVKIWNHKTWLADKYTTKGYDSTGYVLYADPIEKIEEEPYYTKVSGPSSPTSP